MDQNNESVTVVIIESSIILMAEELDGDTATTLIALISEDPSCWDEAMSVWPRYQTQAVCEFASLLPFEPTDSPQAMSALATAESWVAIDFPNKRILFGGSFTPVERHAVYSMTVDDAGDQGSPLSIYLPPWWELHEGACADAVDQPRQTPITRPFVDRDVLYGDALLEDIAARVQAVVQSDEWKNSDANNQEEARYPFTVQVHRAWLMTPRGDLGGRMPRQLLHGALQWSDQVTWGQQLRVQDGGPAIAAPDDWPGFANAPMGSQEMCLYFDLCRELIREGWSWCECKSETPLVEVLREARDHWWNNSFEGGTPPRFIIECDRRRVPRGAGVAITGIDEMPAEEHMGDCDCPICAMMADGMFGIGFTSIDGHHLELDEEFAFSMHETREEWETQQQEHAGFHAEMDRNQAEGDAGDVTDDPFSSAWSGILTGDAFPGDSRGHLQMAFMVAEIVSLLASLGASREDIQGLNECFANYRRSEDALRPHWAIPFKANLQSLADRYPVLESRSADLQSRIDDADRPPRARAT